MAKKRKPEHARPASAAAGGSQHAGAFATAAVVAASAALAYLLVWFFGTDSAEPLRVPVYVIHYTQLSARRRAMQAQLEAHGISATWVTEFDREELSDDVRQKYYER